MDDDFLGTLMFLTLIFGAVCGLIGAILADKKNLQTWAGLLLGFLLGPIGVLIIAVTRSNPDPAPKGMKSVVCPTCNARQNIAKDSWSYDCWQCKQRIDLARA
ncbi:hypothetical protein [Rhodococcus opacus]|uniref:hypothetical protein n=1 Tax=Rhodococcus opacus TaxID=37919 RepID=UPI0010DF1BB4|nr:hypothetical protein [Rhodococcus opacus]MDJ0419708.1 hypothetical protein [Rhodococcus opacus]RYE39310.1 MAG: hypothetical protein EOP24_44650 [Hyphomicrobiales bacterium]